VIVAATDAGSRLTTGPPTFGLIARTLWAEDERGLDDLKVTVGKPLRSQLAERLPNPVRDQEAWDRRRSAKYDGLRVQIHKDAEQVSNLSPETWRR